MKEYIISTSMRFETLTHIKLLYNTLGKSQICSSHTGISNMLCVPSCSSYPFHHPYSFSSKFNIDKPIIREFLIDTHS